MCDGEFKCPVKFHLQMECPEISLQNRARSDFFGVFHIVGQASLPVNLSKNSSKSCILTNACNQKSHTVNTPVL